MGRCNAKSVTRTGFTSSGCQCVNKQGNNLNKKGNPVKKCKRCQQKEALRPNPNVSPPPPPNPNVSPPPPPPPGPNFLEDNVMSMQYGAVEYTPSSPNGNWTSLCQIAAQARSVGYAADRPNSEAGSDSTIPNFAYLRDLWDGKVDVPDIGALYKNNQTTYPTDFMNKPASYMAGTKYFDAASQWYPSLQQNGGSGATADFLTDYFFSAMQTKLGLTDKGAVDWSTALSGSKTISANQQILEKSSTYFVATTHAMYYLQLAEEAIAKNDTAGAKNHFDSIAAVYFGCGDTNPVPLPIYTPDSVVTTAPQVPTQITWTKDSAQKSGDRGTVYFLYNLANKRASNYGRCGSSQSGSCTTAKDAKTTSGTVTVADLNLVVADALNYGTSGPSAAAVNNIRDVRFSDITVTIDGGEQMVYTFCDPSGYKGASNPDASLATNTALYDSNMKADGVQAPEGSYFATVFGTGDGTGTEPNQSTDITTAQAAAMSRVWDPVMAVQLTRGGMCCDALYYGDAGVGRPTIAEVGSVSEFEPPLAGGVMAAESPVGTMCPMHGSGNGYSTSTVGNVNQVNPKETLLLEGQAFYVSLAPSQYSLPLTSTTDETQTANEAKQKQSATQITSMMKMNKKEKVASDGTAPTFGATVAESTAGTPGKFGYSYSAIDFPLWKVGIGSTDPVNQYIVPNGYCYANACFNDFAEVGTQPTFKGAEELGELVQGPNMALVEADEACGRANAACAAPPATWNGAPAVMATCYGSDCTTAGILATTGVIPVA